MEERSRAAVKAFSCTTPQGNQSSREGEGEDYHKDLLSGEKKNFNVKKVRVVT